jgi:hypothetical protein
MGPKKFETGEEKEARLAKNRDAYRKKKANETLEDRAARLEKLKMSREKRKALETVQERDLRLQQMKDAQYITVHKVAKRIAFG